MGDGSAAFSAPSGLPGRGAAGKPSTSHQAPVAQLDRASGFEPAGRVFDSPRARTRDGHSWAAEAVRDRAHRFSGSPALVINPGFRPA
jgi:hypothetical protein